MYTSKIVAATRQPLPEESADKEDWKDKESYCEKLKIEIEVQDAFSRSMMPKLMIFFHVSPTKMSYLQEKRKVITKKVVIVL